LFAKGCMIMVAHRLANLKELSFYRVRTEMPRNLP
jgi:hypothetical protein